MYPPLLFVDTHLDAQNLPKFPNFPPPAKMERGREIVCKCSLHPGFLWRCGAFGYSAVALSEADRASGKAVLLSRGL